MRTTARATRSTRHTRRLPKNTAVAVVVLAALSFTLAACDGGGGGGGGVKEGDKAPGVGTGPGGGTDGTDTARETHPEGGESGGSGETVVPRAAGDGCTLGPAKVRLQDTGGSAPAVLLKITNNGGKACPVFGAPVVGDKTTGENLPVADDTRRRSAIRLEPGRSAYAAINLAGMDADQTHRSKTFTVTLATKDGRGAGGRVTVVSPGAAGLLLDADSRVTHWQRDLADALS
ncbi:DUF4232 domain-containing protein [Streptomyces sp. NPDC055060]